MSDIEKVKQLRKSTGAGFKDCNSALKESNGNLEKAAEILRVKGIAKASKKMSRNATEGVVVVSGDEEKMSLIEINCETDFVAKNDDFINFVKELSELNNNYSSEVEKLKKALMKNNKTVDENLVALIAKIGEKITIGRSMTLNLENSRNFAYQHSVVKDKSVIGNGSSTVIVTCGCEVIPLNLTLFMPVNSVIAVSNNELPKFLNGTVLPSTLALLLLKNCNSANIFLIFSPLTKLFPN